MNFFVPLATSPLIYIPDIYISCFIHFFQLITGVVKYVNITASCGCVLANITDRLQ